MISNYIEVYFILVLLVASVYLFGFTILNILKPIIIKLGINTELNLNKYEHLVLALIVYRLIWFFIVFFEKYTGSGSLEFTINTNLIFFIISYSYYFTLYSTDFFAVVFVLICFFEGKVRKKITLIWLCSIIFFIAIDVCFYREYLPTPWL